MKAKMEESCLHVFALESNFLQIVGAMRNIFRYMNRFHSASHTRVVVYKDQDVVEIATDSVFALSKLIADLNIERKIGGAETLFLDVGTSLAHASTHDTFLLMSTNNRIYNELKHRKNFLFISPDWLRKIARYEQSFLYTKNSER